MRGRVGDVIIGVRDRNLGHWNVIDPAPPLPPNLLRHPQILLGHGMRARGQIAFGQRLRDVGFGLAQRKLDLRTARVAQRRKLLKLRVDASTCRSPASAGEDRQSDRRADDEVVRLEVKVVVPAVVGAVTGP